MAGIKDMNIILSQGNMIKEVQSVRKQGLDVNQHFVAQKAVDKQKKDKSKVQKSKNEKNIEINNDEEKKNKRGRHQHRKIARNKTKEEASLSEEGQLIDIKV